MAIKLILANSPRIRYATGAMMYFAQGIPNGLLGIAIPAWLASQGRPWFPIADFGEAARAGPFFSLPSSVCNECHEFRASVAGLPTASDAAFVSRHFSVAAILGVHHLLRLVGAPPAPTTVPEQVFSVSADLEMHRWRIAPNPTCSR